MTKIVTIITTIYDTETKEIQVYKETQERFDDIDKDINGVAPGLLSLTAGRKYTDTTCAKCATMIAVNVAQYQAGANYCHACAMTKLGA